MSPNPLQAGLQALRNIVTRRVPAASSPVQFVLNQPVTTTDPQVVVAGMQEGTYTFDLVVTDKHGTNSQPMSRTVQVKPAAIE